MPRRADLDPKPLAAFIGNVAGTRPRPLFGLEVERVKPGGC
jgi:hypothetical protein